MISVFRTTAPHVKLSNFRDLLLRHLKGKWDAIGEAIPGESNILYVRVSDRLRRKCLQKELGLLFLFS